MAMKIGRSARTLSAGLGSLLASRGTALPSLCARSFHADSATLTVAQILARNSAWLTAGTISLCYWFDVGGIRTEYKTVKAEVEKASAEYDALCKKLEEQRVTTEKVLAELERERVEMEALEKSMNEILNQKPV